MKRLFKKLANTNISTAYIFILLGISTIMMAGYFSYAWFTVQGVQKYSVVTGNLYGTVAIGTNSVTIAGQGVLTYTPTTDSDTITLTVTNTNDRTVKNSIYYYNLSDSTIQIGYTSDSPTVPSTTGISVNQNKTLTYKIKIKNAKGKQIKIGSSIGLNNSNLTLPSGTTAFSLLIEPIRGTAEEMIVSTNPETLDYNAATTDQKNQMWAFSHEATTQLKATTDYRYIGADPNNYVKFNDELWRIIGVFDVDDGTGKIEKRMKIIRNESIGMSAWDRNNSNEWSASSLNATLNTETFYTGLNDTAKLMIGDAKWYLGGSSTYNNVTPPMFYQRERGTTVYSGRSTNWTGKVGLMYPSDYGYATSGGTTINRTSCMTKELYNWDNYSDCKNNGWISAWQLTMSSRADTSNNVFFVTGTGYINFSNANGNSEAHPVVHLKSTIKVISGTGSSTDPFVLS